MRDLQCRRRKDGFTLIEVLIVIVVLGVLAAVVVFAAGGAANSADEGACKVERRVVLTAAQAYEAETGGLPTLNDLVASDWLESVPTNYDVDGSPLPSGRC